MLALHPATTGPLMIATLLASVGTASCHQVTVVIETRIKNKPLSFEAGMKSTQTITADFDTKKISSEFKTGVTKIGSLELKSIRDKFVVGKVQFKGKVAAFQAVGETASGVKFMPNINYRFFITIDLAAKEVVIDGCHDGYPSYTVTIDSGTLYNFEQEYLGALFGSCDTVVARTTKKL